MRNLAEKLLLRSIIILGVSELLLTAIENYIYRTPVQLSVVFLHIFLLSALYYLAIKNWLLKPGNEPQTSNFNLADYYKYALDQHSIVALTDTKGNILDVNDKFCAISGYERQELIGKNHRIINSGRKDKHYWRDMYRTIACGNIWKDEVLNKAKDGSFYWVDTTIVPILNHRSKPQSYISIRTEITRQKELQEAVEKTNQKLKKLSEIDDLTGLANRRAYEKYISSAIHSAQRATQTLSMLVVDIDDFKRANDNFGHDTGDIILRKVAEKIQASISRLTDFAARYGGEEFIILMPSTEVEGACQVAERIRSSIEQLDESDFHNRTETRVTVSIGISSLSGMSLDKNTLFKQADSALYKSKSTGKNRVTIFDKSLLS